MTHYNHSTTGESSLKNIIMYGLNDKIFQKKSLLSGKIHYLVLRFFAPLRYAQNDSYLSDKVEGVTCRCAACNPLYQYYPATPCHSERSEESHNFYRTTIKTDRQICQFFKTICLIL